MPGHTEPEPCPGCGVHLPGGFDGCQSIMDELLTRDFSDVNYFRSHRLMVDTYSLQHPERYCKSVKSFVAHFTGLCWLLEYSGNRAVGGERLRRWLGQAPGLFKPSIPQFRGSITILDVRHTADPSAYAREVESWARSTWETYSPLHGLARDWIRQAFR